MKSLEQESQYQKNQIEKANNHHSKSHRDNFIRDLPMNTYHVIDREANILNEIKDIRDEMNMLRALAEAQENVWKQASIHYDSAESSVWTNICTPGQVLQELGEMTIEAETIQNAVGTLFLGGPDIEEYVNILFIDKYTVRSTTKTSHHQGGRARTSTSQRHRQAIQHHSRLHNCNDCICEEYLP